MVVPHVGAAMGLFLDFPLTTLFVLAVTAWVTVAVVRRRQGEVQRTAVGGSTCQHCGAPLPPVAKFCRNCGREVTG